MTTPLEGTGAYQIYAVRDGSYELTGYWGSEDAHFRTEGEATEAAEGLAVQYPDTGWAVAEPDGYVVHEIPPPEEEEEEGE